MLQKILDIVFPKRCPICGKAKKRKESRVCKECQSKVTIITEPVCKRCGKPVAGVQSEYCFDCDGKEMSYDRGYAVWIYDKYMKASLAQFKYSGRREYSEYYVREVLYHLGSTLLSLDVDAIIPVPLHKEKQRFRGFNQAQILAEGIANGLHKSVYSDVLLRKRNTRPQKGLDDKARRANVNRAFVLSEKGKTVCHSWESVLLVDDIYTTGATINACARELKENGVKEVYSICLCIGKDF